jgi:hypothetical protein
MSEFLYNDSELQQDTFLILCLEEVDDDDIDNRVFIGWCNGTKNFIVRGKRTDIGPNQFVPYSFHCETANALYTFLEFTLGKTANLNMTLYNYNNIYNTLLEDEGDCKSTNVLTYEFFEAHMHKDYEISGYDMAKLSRKHMLRYLKMLMQTRSWE